MAERVFKEEIANRLSSGELPVANYLINNHYLKYLSNHEIETIINSTNFQLIEKIFEAYRNLEIIKEWDYNTMEFAHSILHRNISMKISTKHKNDKFIYFSLRKKFLSIFKNKNIKDLEILLKRGFLKSLSKRFFLVLMTDPEIDLIKNVVNLLEDIQGDHLAQFFDLDDKEDTWFTEKFNLLGKNIIKSKVKEIIREGNFKTTQTLMRTLLTEHLKYNDIKELMVKNSEDLLNSALLVEKELREYYPKYLYYEYKTTQHVFSVAQENSGYFNNLKEDDKKELLNHLDFRFRFTVFPY